MKYSGSWEKNLPWVEFLYNNSYQESLKMARFDVLYGRCCRTPLNWIELGEKVIFGSDIVDVTEARVHRIQDNLKLTKSRQESYANKKCRSLEFEVEDHLYLKVSPVKGMERFGIKGKLAPHYIGPFPILEKCGTVAYKSELSPLLARVHDIAQGRFDIPRAPNQDLRSKESCHEVQGDQVLQGSMEQPYYRRSNIRK
jgi:hypothetical protein